MAPNYVDSACQTMIAGLTKHPDANPAILFDASTPPEDTPDKDVAMHSQDLEMHSKALAVSDHNLKPSMKNLTSTLLYRRQHKLHRPPLVARLSLPHSEIEDEVPPSPPPTDVVVSPLPLANRLHAGHTPIIPRARSPMPFTNRQRSVSEPSTPDEDIALDGPLQLPAQPGDGNEDHIELKVLDAELEKIASLRTLKGKEEDEPSYFPSQTAENGGQNSRKGSSETHRRSSADSIPEVVDGVILKKPKMNMGAPLGQA